MRIKKLTAMQSAAYRRRRSIKVVDGKRLVVDNERQRVWVSEKELDEEGLLHVTLEHFTKQPKEEGFRWIVVYSS